MTKVVIAPGDYAGLHKEVVSVVESALRTAARNVNAVMTLGQKRQRPQQAAHRAEDAVDRHGLDHLSGAG